MPVNGPSDPREEDAQAILSLGLLSPTRMAWDPWAAVERLGTMAAADLIFRHKVTSIVRDRIADENDDSIPRDLARKLDEHLRTASSVMAARWRNMHDVLELVTQLADETRVEWWTMKGGSFRQYYPQGIVRDVGDLDVLVRTVDDGWRLTRKLIAAGYSYLDAELPWFKRDVVSGELYGQIRLTDPAKERLSIDIHAGPYSIRYCGLMPLDLPSGDGRGTPLALDEDFCAVIANAAGDCFISTKLVNDILLALDLDIDVDKVMRTLDRGCLLPFLVACLERVDGWCELSVSQKARLEDLRPEIGTEPVPPLVRADPQERCATVLRHAAAVADRLDLPAETRRLILDGAEEAYGREHPLVLVDAQAPSGLPELNNWTCVRMVPFTLDTSPMGAGAGVEPGRQVAEPVPLSSELSVISTTAGSLVGAAGEVFVPTVDFEIPRSYALIGDVT